MADLNALIAQGVQFQRPPDPFAQYGQMQQLQQGQQQNQLNQMKMAEYQRNMGRQESLHNTLAGFKQDMPIAEQVNELVRRGHLAEAKSLAESHAKSQKDMRDAETAHLANIATKTELAGQILAGVKDESSYQRALPRLMAIDPKAAAAMPPTYDPAFIASEVQSGLKLKDQLEQHFQEQNLVGGVRTISMRKYGGGPATAVQGSEAAIIPLPANVEAQKARIALAGRPPAQPRPEQPPVAVVDPNTNKIVYVSREEALANRMTPATSIEGIAPKEIQKREAAYPAATSAVKSTEDSADNLIKDLQTLRDHPGLGQITGIAAGRLPAVTAAGRAAQALYDKVLAKGGFQMLQDLRNASKTGGALGNVSNQEGSQLKSAFAAIDRTQDAPDVRNAIDGAIANAQGSKARVREAYDTTYEYKAGAKVKAPAPSGVDTSNPLLR